MMLQGFKLTDSQDVIDLAARQKKARRDGHRQARPDG
jgi:hypothetical protein